MTLPTFTPAVLKNVVIACVLDTLLLTTAHAQDQKTEPAAAPAETPAQPAVKPETPAPAAKPNHGTPATVLDLGEVDGVIGKSVRSATGEDMGHIIDVIVSGDGKVRAAVIDFGGFLGVGSRKVAVDWHALQFGKDGKTGNVTSALTRDQVRISPEIKSGEPIVVLGLAQEKPTPEKPEKSASGVNGKTPENIPASQPPASQSAAPQATAPQAPPPAAKTEPTETAPQKP